MDFLNTYINPVTFGICLIAGYIIKHWLKDVNNRIIPTVVALLGILIALWTNHWTFSPEILLGGALSGLASTGAHQLFKQWMEGSGKKQKE